MWVLCVGLLLFLGVHSVRLLAPAWRERQIARLGAGSWRLVYSLVSVLGFGLIVWGYGLARQQPVVLWVPWVGGRHLAVVLTLVAFVLIAASQVPGNAIRARLGHPMLIGTKLWALAHLVANHTLADLVLFGAFLVWAVLAFRSARRRPAPVPGAVTHPGRTGLAVAAGVVSWVVFLFWAHAPLIGVAPMGR